MGVSGVVLNRMVRLAGLRPELQIYRLNIICTLEVSDNVTGEKYLSCTCGSHEKFV